jgi:hypothetical protein
MERQNNMIEEMKVKLINTGDNKGKSKGNKDKEKQK